MGTNSKEYIRKYEAETVQQVKFQINRKTEPELLAWIASKPNKQGYIKDLILRDMGKQENIPTFTRDELQWIKKEILAAQKDEAETQTKDAILKKLNLILYGLSE